MKGGWVGERERGGGGVGCWMEKVVCFCEKSKNKLDRASTPVTKGRFIKN